MNKIEFLILFYLLVKQFHFRFVTFVGEASLWANN